MEKIHLFCPATIANISCGFDVLGVCLDTIGDEMIIRKTDRKGIHIVKIEGADLPYETSKNVAGVAGLALLEKIHPEHGFEIELIKKIKPGSGIGSSAASAAGAVFGINALLNSPFKTTDLIEFAMQGEFIASRALHADNVAPALLGGFTLVRDYTPLDVVKIHTPNELFISILHPQIEIKTEDARAVLKKNIPLQKAIVQWGNLGGLISGLFTEDYNLIGRSLKDEIVEPHRSILIPGFDILKKTAKENGALGSGIAGSGPSVFAFSKGYEQAEKVTQQMAAAFNTIQVPYTAHTTSINTKGIKIIAS